MAGRAQFGRRRKYLPNEEFSDIDELYRRLDDANAQIDLLSKLMAQRQHYSVWREPLWENGYAQVPDPHEPFAYKIASSRFPVFKGHIDVSGATSDTVAFTLDLLNEDIVLPYAVKGSTIVTDDGGTNFVQAMMKLDDVTGEFSLVWPHT